MSLDHFRHRNRLINDLDVVHPMRQDQAANVLTNALAVELGVETDNTIVILQTNWLPTWYTVEFVAYRDDFVLVVENPENLVAAIRTPDGVVVRRCSLLGPGVAALMAELHDIVNARRGRERIAAMYLGLMALLFLTVSAMYCLTK